MTPLEEEYVVRNNKSVKIRPWRAEDIAGIVDCHRAAYDDYPPSTHYDARLFEMQLDAFPEGQVLAEEDGRIIGYATAIIVQLEEDNDYTYAEITGAATFSTHEPSGDTLYGADIAVHPGYRGRGVAGKLYDYRRKLVKRYNLRRMLAYGRIPGYAEVAGRMTAQAYVDQVLAGQRKDPALSAHVKAGYRVKGVVLDLFRDRSSLNYSTLLEWDNPDFRPERRRIAAAPLKVPVRKMRVCAAQYKMRPIKSWDELAESVGFFVETADAYYCHFLLLPELFTAQLFSAMPVDWPPDRAIRELTTYTERYIEMFRSMARSRNLYIIGGSHPVLRDGKIYNVAHMFSPSGKVYTQDKLHITPSERKDWGIEPGESIKIFDTSLGRIAIQVCYDIEFPEVARLLTLAGVQVIFVPFSTDEKKAYHRVRYTAQARAVENIIYTVIAGNVGNLPNRSYLLNYGQAAVFTPSDFGFAPNATAAEAEPNLETVVIADIDFTALLQQREVGSVRPLHDRRQDLYDIRPRQPIEIVRVE